MGLPANAYLTFENYPETLQLFEISDLSQLIKIASQSRPDLLAQEAMVRSYEQKFLRAQEERYPTISGDFSLGRKYTNLGINDYFDYDATLKFKLPLFRGFHIQNDIKKARAMLRFEESKLKDLQLELLQAVTASYNDVIYAKESYTYATEYVKASIEDYRVNLKEYKMGTTNIVDLINAQTAVADAQYKLINSEKQWYTSIANLAYAMGVLSNNPEKDENIYPSNEDPSPSFLRCVDETHQSD